MKQLPPYIDGHLKLYTELDLHYLFLRLVPLNYSQMLDAPLEKKTFLVKNFVIHLHISLGRVPEVVRAQLNEGISQPPVHILDHSEFCARYTLMLKT